MECSIIHIVKVFPPGLLSSSWGGGATAHPCPYCFLTCGKVTAFFTLNKHLSVSNCSKKFCSTPWSARCCMLPMTRGRPKSSRKPMMGQKTWVMMFDQSNQTSKKTFDDSVARRVGSEIFTHFIWAQSMKRGGHRGYENEEVYLYFSKWVDDNQFSNKELRWEPRIKSMSIAISEHVNKKFVNYLWFFPFMYSKCQIKGNDVFYAPLQCF